MPDRDHIMRGDLRTPWVIAVKGGMFVLLALLAGGLLLIELPSWKAATLLLLCVWASCRFYYFVFFVIRHYLDPQFEYRGMMSAIRYFAGRRSVRDPSP